MRQSSEWLKNPCAISLTIPCVAKEEKGKDFADAGLPELLASGREGKTYRAPLRLSITLHCVYKRRSQPSRPATAGFPGDFIPSLALT
jgi:hypothetical protein